MKKWIATVLFSAVVPGCVTLQEYQQLQIKVGRMENEKTYLQSELHNCREETERLRDNSKKTLSPPVKKDIEKSDLDEIKKKALEEAEQKFQDRVKTQNEKAQ